VRPGGAGDADLALSVASLDFIASTLDLAGVAGAAVDCVATVGCGCEVGAEAAGAAAASDAASLAMDAVVVEGEAAEVSAVEEAATAAAAAAAYRIGGSGAALGALGGDRTAAAEAGVAFA